MGYRWYERKTFYTKYYRKDWWLILNQFVVVGRLAKDINIIKENNKKYAVITLAIPRSYKNEKGEYDTDFLEIIAYDNIAENTKQYVKVGDILGAKGRIEKLSQDNPTCLIGDKITFLSSGKKSEESE